MTSNLGDRPPPEMVRRVQSWLVTHGARADPANLARAIRSEAAGVVDDAHMLSLIRHLEQELTGCGPLTALLADPSTTDVVVNAPADVRVDRGCGWERTDVTFADEEAVQRLARRLAAMAGARLDDSHPYVDGRLPDGTRLHAMLPPLASTGTCLSLRVLRPVRYHLDALQTAGLLPGVTRPVLRAILDARLAFVVSGGTGSGKTTLLGALLGAVDPAERIVTVEDADELRPTHPHVVRLVSRAANVEGFGAIGLRELVRQALRMRPDRLVVGEVRGSEVVDLLGALSTGHDGGAGTIHANSAQDVPGRFAALGVTSGMSLDALQAQLAGAVQVVAHLRRDRAQRRLAEIAVLSADSNGKVQSIPAVRDGTVVSAGGAILSRMLASRGVPPPWPEGSV